MATYYVRKNGSDANSTAQAQDPATAWLTIDKAANNVAAGDTVYVGAGTYRESVTMDTSGSSGNQISFIADVDGSQTGDAGLVVISAFTDSNTATRTFCWDPDGRTFVTVRGFVMQGGTNAVCLDANTTASNYEEVVFEDCVFVDGPSGSDGGFQVDMNSATTPTGNGLTIRRCTFQGSGVKVSWDGNATADQNLKITVENCFMLGNGSISSGVSFAFYFDIVTSDTFASGGVTFTNNTVIGFRYGVYVEHGTSTTYPVATTNNLFLCANPLFKVTSNDGALTSAHNTYQGTYTAVTAGTGDRNETSTWMVGGITDQPLYTFLGWSPYLPFAPMRPNSDDDWTSLIGDASATYAPADDLYGNPRPMHGTADDRGAVEGRARAEQETTTVRTGGNAMRFEGAGLHDLLIPVAAQSTTVSVYGRYDSNHTGSLPLLEVFNIPGVADQSDVMTGGANAWEQLTVTFTPTAAGVARVRLSSRDTSATGEAFFDDLTVT